MENVFGNLLLNDQEVGNSVDEEDKEWTIVKEFTGIKENTDDWVD